MKFRCSAKFEDYLKTKVYPLKNALEEIVISQKEAIETVILGLIGVSQRDFSIAGERYLGCGSILLEGPTGIGKTVLAKATAALLSGINKRISGVPDLQPSDIAGGEVFLFDSSKRVVHGPFFEANIAIIDEITRLSPKCQSAFIEMLAEGSVTIGDNTYKLKSPFIAIGTLNPSENARGMSKLNEAISDRFLFKVLMKPTDIQEKIEIAKRTHKFDVNSLKQISSMDEINEARIHFFDNTYIDDKIRFYIARLLNAINNPHELGLYEKERKELEHTPIFRQQPALNDRALIHAESAAMANAVLQGRDYVIPKDVQQIALRVLRGRLLLNPASVPSMLDLNPHLSSESALTDYLITEALLKVEI